MVVDTSVAGKEAGRIDVEHAGLHRQARDRPVLVAVHHPPVTLSLHPWFQLDGASDVVVELRRRPNVGAVVSGHLHQAFAVQLDHVSYIGAPSAWYAITHTGTTSAKPRTDSSAPTSIPSAMTACSPGQQCLEVQRRGGRSVGDGPIRWFTRY